MRELSDIDMPGFAHSSWHHRPAARCRRRCQDPIAIAGESAGVARLAEQDCRGSVGMPDVPKHPPVFIVPAATHRMPSVLPSFDSANGRDQSFHVRSRSPGAFKSTRLISARKESLASNVRPSRCDVEDTQGPHRAMHDPFAAIASHAMDGGTAPVRRRGEPDLISIRRPCEAVRHGCPFFQDFLHDGAVAVDDSQPLGAPTESFLFHHGDQCAIRRNPEHLYRMREFIDDLFPSGYSTHERPFFGS